LLKTVDGSLNASATHPQVFFIDSDFFQRLFTKFTSLNFNIAALDVRTSITSHDKKEESLK